jgi:uncharacterized protein
MKSVGAPLHVACSDDERTWAIIAHLAWLIGGPIGPFAVWLVKKDESRYVAFQALQEAVYQAVIVVAYMVLTALSIVASIPTFGLAVLCCVPVLLAFWFAAIGYSCYAAYQCSNRVDFRYPWLADFVEKNWQPGPAAS